MQKSFLFKCIVLLSVGLYQPVFAEAEESSEGAGMQGDSILVNLNTASADELSSMLSGVGLAKAEAIIAYRVENGNFESVEDLVMVSGIGVQTLEENKALLTIE